MHNIHVSKPCKLCTISQSLKYFEGLWNVSYLILLFPFKISLEIDAIEALCLAWD